MRAVVAFLLTLCVHLCGSFQQKFLPKRIKIPLLRSALLNPSELDSSAASDSGSDSTILKSSEVVKKFLTRLDSSIDMAGNDQSLLVTARQAGSAYLAGAKVMSGKDEAWRYTNLKRLLSPFIKGADISIEVTHDDISPYIDEQCKDACLVFVDGSYRSDLSSIHGLSDMINSHQIDIGSLQSGQLQQQTLSYIKSENILKYMIDVDVPNRDSFGSDILAAMNMVNLKDVAVLRLSKNNKIDQPIQVLFYSSDTNGTVSSPRLVCLLEEGSSLHVKQHFAGGGSALNAENNNIVSKDSEVFVNSNTRIILKKEASLTHTYIQELGSEGRHIETLISDVDESSSYDVSILQMGGRLGRTNVHIDLLKSGANMSINGTLLAHSRQSLDMHSNINHSSADTSSRQQQRNVIGDKGEAIFKGRIRVPEIAQRTDSDQLCRSLMLGDRARVIAMPTLEITADDVTCSHGASVADLDENAMFYLSSRGINRTQARKLLLRGFVFEMLANSILGEKLLQRIVDKIECLNPVNDEGMETKGSRCLESI
jgi:Fe-S cluster assembly protein SufD